MDLSTVFGLAIGVLGILLGNSIEGGHFSALIQGTAFIIVFGGTLGATVLANTSADLNRGLKSFGGLFQGFDEKRVQKIVRDLGEISKVVKAEGVLAVEGRLKAFDPALQTVVKGLIDGFDADRIHSLYGSQLDYEEKRILASAKVWTDAGGYAPTIGILGAVLGLIHVMGNISDTSMLGKGIAVAFVATIYGVGSANLIFLPSANKIKVKGQKEIALRQMIIDCVAMIAKGEANNAVKNRAESFLNSGL